MKMVKVEVLAEQLSYSKDNGDGTHTRFDYVRGDVFEMDEASALQAAEGEPSSKEVYEVEVNSVGSHVFANPKKKRGVPRAAVRILPESDAAPVTAPQGVTQSKPAPAPKPAGSDRK